MPGSTVHKLIKPLPSPLYAPHKLVIDKALVAKHLFIE